jgi:hypothetical protein
LGHRDAGRVGEGDTIVKILSSNDRDLLNYRCHALIFRPRVNESAPNPIGAGSSRMESLACFCLILGVSEDSTDLLFSMGKLALGSVSAVTSFIERFAKLSLISVLNG